LILIIIEDIRFTVILAEWITCYFAEFRVIQPLGRGVLEAMQELSPTLDRVSMKSLNLGRTRPVVDEVKKRTSRAGHEEARSDEALLIAVGNTQDRVAFEQLFSRFSSRIYALGMKLTRNEQLSHDLVQEAMLTVWKKAPLYDLDRGTAQSWIFTLTRNRCFDILRKQKRQPNCISADDIWPQDGEPAGSLVNEETATQEIEVSQIESFYNELPDAQKAVVEQIFIFDRTHEEAARVLDIPLGTLKSRLRLGVAKLKQHVGVDE